MSRYLKTHDDRWEVKLGRHAPHPGVGTVLFFSTKNNQRPWRVAEIQAGRFASQEALEALDDGALGALFARADIMDFVHEARADPHHRTKHVQPPTDNQAR